MNGDGGLTMQRKLELGRVSRSSFYRFDPEGKSGADRDMELRDAIQHIALEWPCYGRPRITAELRRQGWTVNPKRVYRLMREDNLLCVRKRKFILTTDSNHGRTVYPNLARELVLTGVNQLWIADLTYIRLETEFVFLAAILDAFSRRVIGWALDRNLDDELTLAALRMAIQHRSPRTGLVHHSDRGSQPPGTGPGDRRPPRAAGDQRRFRPLRLRPACTSCARFPDLHSLRLDRRQADVRGSAARL